MTKKDGQNETEIVRWIKRNNDRQVVGVARWQQVVTLELPHFPTMLIHRDRLDSCLP